MCDASIVLIIGTASDIAHCPLHLQMVGEEKISPFIGENIEIIGENIENKFTIYSSFWVYCTLLIAKGQFLNI